MKLTPTQLHELLQIVDKFTLTFIAHHVGSDVLSNHQKSILTNAGVNFANVTPASSNITQAFKFGILSDALHDSIAKKMTYEQLKQHIKLGKMFKLTPLEVAALDNLKLQTATQVMKFSDRVKGDITDILVHADKKNHTVKHHKIVTDATKRAIEERKGVQSVISDIGHSLNNWERDFGRIADFVMHTAFDEGRAANIQKDNGDDALVFKDVYPGACPHCIKAFLTGGIGSPPKIFKLSELIANGTNVGRKTAEWLPVIGPHHPWCRCTLNKVPQGFTVQDNKDGLWLWTGRDFIRDSQKFKRKVERKSKVKVTVNGKTTEI